MISKIDFKSYKKLKNIELEFIKGINIIAGNNGTCKSSILHVVSNSYKSTVSTSDILEDTECLKVIKDLNKHVGPKIESLNKGSQLKNDPSNGEIGSLYSVTFEGGSKQSFRKHNSKMTSRYAIKPYYPKGKSEKLREAIIIYLSLDRLFPYAEYQVEEKILKLSSKLPDGYVNQIQDTFEKFTTHKISIQSMLDVGSIKKRYQFKTANEYIDSNTISSGEDNLLIMLIALYSLVYYCDSLKKDSKDSPAYLLIDEFDASLHPEFQVKFLEHFNEVNRKYDSLSLVATTHSLTTIEESIKRKYNLIYLVNRGERVHKMSSPDLGKIETNLMCLLNRDLYEGVNIPVISEDKQARVFLKKLFEHYLENKKDFKEVFPYFNLVEASFSSETIKTLFKSTNVPRRHFPSIGILDGDQSLDKEDIGNCLVALPGDKSPEKLIYEICMLLKDDSSDNAELFWNSIDEGASGFSYDYMVKKVIPEFEQLEKQIKELTENGESVHGVYRERSKKIFDAYETEFAVLLVYWINLPINKEQINKFYDNFRIAFHKIYDYHGIKNFSWID